MPDRTPPLSLTPLSISAWDVEDIVARLESAVIRAEAMADVAYTEMVAAEAEHRAAQDAWEREDSDATEYRVDLCWTDAHKATQRHDRAKQAVDDLEAACKLVENAVSMLRMNEAGR